MEDMALVEIVIVSPTPALPWKVFSFCCWRIKHLERSALVLVSLGPRDKKLHRPVKYREKRRVMSHFCIDHVASGGLRYDCWPRERSLKCECLEMRKWHSFRNNGNLPVTKTEIFVTTFFVVAVSEGERATLFVRSDNDLLSFLVHLFCL